MIINLLIRIALGAAVGWAAGKLMKVNLSLLSCILLGIAGSIVGTVLASLLGFDESSNILSYIINVAGACLVVFLYRRFAK
jgi:uncharacterized membrane protein YeaQ/YmgE (transglycosylase-associated protein family)